MRLLALAVSLSLVSAPTLRAHATDGDGAAAGAAAGDASAAATEDDAARSARGIVLTLADADPLGVDLALQRTRGLRGLAIEQITLPPAASSARSQAPLEALEARYVDGDFLGCLAALAEADLDTTRWLAEGDRDHAASIAVIGAGCAYGAGNESLARSLLRELFVRQLPLTALERTTPELAALAEATRASLPTSTAPIAFESEPAGASVAVDGVLRCTAPCTVELPPGEHLVRLTRLGHRARDAVVSVREEAHTERLALDVAPSDVLAAQLAEATRSAAPDDVELARAAATVWGARVVLLAWTEGATARAASYDRATGRFVAHASAPIDASAPSEATAHALEQVVREWHGLAYPTPIYEEPAFWLVTGAVVGVVAVAVWGLAQPPERTFALEVP